MKEKYWIFYTIYYCPVCGTEKIHRERRYDKKPKKYNKRREYIHIYDLCDEYDYGEL